MPEDNSHPRTAGLKQAQVELLHCETVLCQGTLADLLNTPDDEVETSDRYIEVVLHEAYRAKEAIERAIEALGEPS